MNAEKLLEDYSNLINASYVHFLRRIGIDKVAVKAEGATITDEDGRTYIDCVGGYGLFNLGHNHPQIIQALQSQLNSGALFTRPLISEIQVELAKKLAEVSPNGLDCSFVCNSGSEAVDTALKLARLCTRRTEMITARNSFHGFTMGALSASGIARFKENFEPLVPGFSHVRYGDYQSLEKAVTENTAAILLEPIQHEAGIEIPTEDYFKNVRKLCDQKGILLILDEIKTGIGKTGRLFAAEHFELSPDILVLGKALGGGLVPIGAVLARKSIWRKFGLSFPMSASSFAGNALASRAALETLHIVCSSNLLDDCKKNSCNMIERLSSIQKSYPSVIESTKGLGFLIGIQTTDSRLALNMAKHLVRNHVLALPAFGNPSVIMLEPPLVIDNPQIEKVLYTIEAFCRNQQKEVA